MKKVSLATFFLVSLVAAGFIYSRPPGAGNPPHFDSAMGLNHLQQAIGLSDKQVDTLFQIGTKYRNLCFENRKNPEKLYSLREARRNEVEKVFTKEQKAKLDEMKKDRPMRGRGCR